MTLLTLKHENADFFTADIFDQTPFKDDIASMEHPIFTLATNPDRRQIEYKNGDKEIKISPHFEYGLPTIFDKDLLLYCASLLMAELNKGNTPPKTIRISPHDFFVATNRNADSKIGGNNYKLLKKSFERLKGCSIRTNIKTNNRHITEGFGVIDSYRIIESNKVKNRMIRLEITVSDWFYNSILAREMLTINKDYFRLRKPIERRLYEIARKHCGNQKCWSIGLENLFLKTGSRGTRRLFKSRFKEIILDGNIPDYQYSINDNDMVTVKRTKAIEADNPPRDEHTSRDMVFNFKRRISKQTLINAEKIHSNSYTDWSMDEIILQFIVFTEKTRKVKDVNAAFIGFLKNKIKTFKKDSYSN